jgi:hypothetical protein
LPLSKNTAGHGLVIVADRHVAGFSIPPDKTEAVLIVDPYAVLPLPAAFEGFQAVAGNRRQIAKLSRLIQVDEFAKSGLFDGPKPLRRLLLKQPFGFGIAKGPNHISIVYR